MKFKFLPCISFFLLTFVSATAWAAHGVSLDGELKYPAGFKKFAYASEKARKGGRLVLHDIGSFDTLEPFTFKGNSPLGIEELLYDPLTVEALDEPFSNYGLLAQDIAVAPDKKSVVFTLNQQARFSDGTPVTAEDVAFTLDTLKGDKAHPYYHFYYADIIGYEILSSYKIKLNFARPNRELHMIAGQIRIMSKSFHTKHPFGETPQDGQYVFPIGSGPYVIDSLKFGKSITYKRNPHYWAINHPARTGLFNYDEITVEYYLDPTVALEAFKAGEFDFISVNIAKQWARDMEGKNFRNGAIIKKTFPHSNDQGIQGFLMNTRRALFKDRRVREALTLALDFPWINKALFHEQYTRSDSYFANSYLKATGLPEGLELDYLQPWREKLPPEVFTTPLGIREPAQHRDNMVAAMRLLNEAGWHIEDNVLVNAQGEPFRFSITLVNKSFERVMAVYVDDLKRLGMEVEYRAIDPALYVERLKTFDFDMIVMVYGQSQSPGNEQTNYWQSSAADRRGSRNYAGIKSPVVDDLVNKIVYAKNREELTAACRALDRVLWYGYYLVPNWYLPYYRLAFWDKFSFPSQLPLYYDPFQLVMTWWIKEK